MEDQKIMPVALKYGLIGSLILIIYSLILNITELSMNQSYGYLSYLILGGVIFLAAKNYKELNDGFLSFSKSFTLGVVISAVSGVTSSIFSYIYLVFIDDMMLQKVKEMQIMEMEKQGMTDSQIDQALSIVEVFMTPAMISIMALIGLMFVGAVLSLIVAAIIKNPRPEFE